MYVQTSRALLSALVWVCLTGGTFAICAGKRGTALAIIPKPTMIEVHKGVFVLGPRTQLCLEANSSGMQRIGEYLCALLSNSIGRKVPFHLATSTGPGRNVIILSLKPSVSLGPEGYEMVVSPDAIRIGAADVSGLFYAVQTLRQMLPPEIETKAPASKPTELPCALIQDRPRFSWRGMMLDCSRTFLPTDYLKRNIDRMALYKLNILHLHLTDDQGWRVEIKKYPQLTAVGAHYANRFGGAGGYYTQKEIRDLVVYAKERNITIVPEIEMPGHSAEVQAAYPELACELPEKRIFEVHPFWVDPAFAEPLCAGNEKCSKSIRTSSRKSSICFRPNSFMWAGMKHPRIPGRNARDARPALRPRG